MPPLAACRTSSCLEQKATSIGGQALNLRPNTGATNAQLAPSMAALSSTQTKIASNGNKLALLWTPQLHSSSGKNLQAHRRRALLLIQTPTSLTVHRHYKARGKQLKTPEGVLMSF